MKKEIKEIWFDVDDVMVDTSAMIEKSLRDLTGKSIDITQWPHHNFPEIYGFDVNFMEKVRYKWLEDQILENAPLRAGVAEAMKDLANQGYKLGLITARSWHPQGEAVTWAMVEKYNIPVSDIAVLSYDESKVALLEKISSGVQGYVDDTYRHVKACSEKGWYSCVMNQPWNRQYTDLPRVDSMQEFASSFSSEKIPKFRR